MELLPKPAAARASGPARTFTRHGRKGPHSRAGPPPALPGPAATARPGHGLLQWRGPRPPSHGHPFLATPVAFVAQLIGDGRTHRGIGSPAATTWLFPGHLPGRPITPSRLGERLRDIGIYAQTGRRATMLDLAAQLPAAILADPLGLHENTAAKWTNQAGGDWTRYAAELARNHRRQH